MEDYGSKNVSILEKPLLFVHVPKTAGTSVRSIVEYIYPQNQAIRIADYHKKVSIPDFIQFVNGHVPTYFQKHLSVSPLIMTLLRDPIERIISVHRFWRSLPLSDQSGETMNAIALAHQLSLPDFLTSDEPPLEGELRNFHCRWIGNIHEGVDWNSAQLLENAKAVIKNSFWVGIVERLDESLECLAHALALPAQWYEGRLNASPPVDSDMTVPAWALEVARARNQQDYDLYEYANQVLISRLDALRSQAMSWRHIREQKAPPMSERARSFSMQEGMVGSGWWAREEDETFVWRFAFRDCAAMLCVWWPVAGDGYAALWLPYIQSDIAWEDVEIRVDDTPVRPVFLACRIGRIAVVPVEAAMVDLSKMMLISLAVLPAEKAGPVNADGSHLPAPTLPAAYNHSSQTSVSLAAVYWFERSTEPSAFSGPMRNFLWAMKVAEQEIVRAEAAIAFKASPDA